MKGQTSLASKLKWFATGQATAVYLLLILLPALGLSNCEGGTTKSVPTARTSTTTTVLTMPTRAAATTVPLTETVPSPSADQLRPPTPLPAAADAVATTSPTTVQLKFRDGTSIRLRDDSFVTLADDDLSQPREVVANYPDLRIERLFQSSSEQELEEERERLEAKTGQGLPDLNLWYRLVLPSRSEAQALVNELVALPIVETAYVAPPAAPPPAP